MDFAQQGLSAALLEEAWAGSSWGAPGAGSGAGGLSGRAAGPPQQEGLGGKRSGSSRTGLGRR